MIHVGESFAVSLSHGTDISVIAVIITATSAICWPVAAHVSPDSNFVILLCQRKPLAVEACNAYPEPPVQIASISEAITC